MKKKLKIKAYNFKEFEDELLKEGNEKIKHSPAQYTIYGIGIKTNQKIKIISFNDEKVAIFVLNTLNKSTKYVSDVPFIQPFYGIRKFIISSR